MATSRTYVHFWHPEGSFLLKEGIDLDQFSDLLRDLASAPDLREKAALYPQLRSMLAPPLDAPSDEAIKKFYTKAVFIISSVVPPRSAATRKMKNPTNLPSTVLERTEGKPYVLCVYSAEPENPLFAHAETAEPEERPKPRGRIIKRVTGTSVKTGHSAVIAIGKNARATRIDNGGGGNVLAGVVTAAIGVAALAVVCMMFTSEKQAAHTTHIGDVFNVGQIGDVTKHNHAILESLDVNVKL